MVNIKPSAGPSGRDILLWPNLAPVPSISGYRAWLAAIDGQLAHGFRTGRDVEHLVRQRAAAIDQLVMAAWQHFCGDADGVALVAVGGYGRGELHPHSDIDLMILLAAVNVDRLDERLATFLTFLWDLKLDVGHSVRNVAECVEQAAEDVSVATNLMEARLLLGPPALFTEMGRSLSPTKLWPGRAYFQAKFEEQRARHHRFGDTAYNLEPNLKDGPGGLRDIQTVLWVAQRHYNATSLRDLVKVGFLEEAEYRALTEGQRHLWRIRFGLHLLAGRREDRLLFDHQKDLAQLLGFEDDDRQNLAVEQFMQAYFRSVMQLERLNERLLQAFEEDILFSDAAAAVEIIDDAFQARRGYLEFRNPQAVAQHPVILMTLFGVLQQRPELRGVRAAAIRTIRGTLSSVDAAFRADGRVRAAFIALLRHGGDVPELLTRMHRYGILDRYLPAFGAIVGRMQYDLFHIYTVDQHTLFVLRQIYRFSQPSIDNSQYPLVREIRSRLPKPELLYLAGIFHDIAKGRGGDHSELGASDAGIFCRDHGLSDGDVKLVSWLVRQHLLMSVTAQRKDITDPVVVNAFARKVGNLRYLDYLYLLTVADISATSPKLWNSWKARLLSELYLVTRGALQRGIENPLRRSEWVKDTQTDALSMLSDAGVSADVVEAFWSTLPDDYFLRHSADQIVYQTRSITAQATLDLPLVAICCQTPRGASEVCVYCDNRDGSFATIVASLDQAGLSIVDARAINTTDHRIIDTFQVLDRRGDCIDEARATRLRAMLLQNLRAQVLSPPVVRRRRSAKLKHFVLTPQIAFDTDHDRTLMELICSDRPGLLVAVALALLDRSLRIHGARIATFGERVEDYFLITDRQDRVLDEKTAAALRRAVLDRLDASVPAGR